MSYNAYILDMNATIRNLDPDLFRRLKARASLEGKTVGQALNQAMLVYLGMIPAVNKTRSMMDLPHWDFGPGNERLSEEIDEILYGWKKERKGKK